MDEGVNMSDVDPQWLRDGEGVGQPSDYDLDDYTEWNTRAWSRDIQDQDFTGVTGDASCAPSDPPGSGTHIWGSVGGTCQWIDTTTC